MYDKAFEHRDCGVVLYGYCKITPAEEATHTEAGHRAEADIDELNIVIGDMHNPEQGIYNGPFPLDLLCPKVREAIEAKARKDAR